MRKPRGRPAIIDAGDRKALEDFFSQGGQALLPLLELLEKAQGAVDEVIDVMGRLTLEALLKLSAAQVAGPKQQGRPKAGDVYW